MRKTSLRAAMVEALESREMFAATLPSGFVSPTPTFENGVVNVKGTKYDDRITISFDSDGIGIDVNVNGDVTAFFRSTVNGFLINGGKGKDVVKVIDSADQPMTMPITYFGGAGNDVLVSGFGSDTFIGGKGHDKLVNAGTGDTMYQDSAPTAGVI